MAVADLLSAAIADAGGGPVFAHSDPFRAARLVKPVRDRDAYVDAHVSLIREAAGGRPLWIPSFNYEFPKTRIFDVAKSESQLGPIPERFRTTVAQWRTPLPMFSVAGIGAKPRQAWGPMTDPFGAESMFGELVRDDGVILYYGDTFRFNTLVHYSERALGSGPMYRYDKVFEGRVIDENGNEISGSLNYHVRPFGTGLDYDWPRLETEAIEHGVLRRVEGHPEILVASARGLSDLWVGEMRQDPFALLDEKTRRWVEPAIEELGRRFVITDFEAPEIFGAGA